MHQPDHPPADPAPDEALDALIGEALDCQGDAEQVERLQQYWQLESQRYRQQQSEQPLRRRTPWRRAAAAMAAAACLLVAMIGGWMIVASDQREVEQLALEDKPPQAEPSEPKVSPAATDSSPKEATESLSAGRPPTEYERFVFMTQTRQRPPMPRLALEQLVPQAIEQVAARPSENVSAIVQQLTRGQRRFDRGEWEDRLLEALEESPEDQRTAICRLLAVFGSQRSVPALLQQGRSETSQAVALATIEAIVGVEHWADVARGTSNAELRQAIARRLLSADSSPALLAYLELVGDPMLRDDALAAAVDLRDLPIEPLVALLDHEQESVRLAAAVTLGELNRCEMTQAVIARIEARPSRSKEAWFALFSCRCDAADDFLFRATHSPRLLGQLNNARLQWSREVQ